MNGWENLYFLKLWELLFLFVQNVFMQSFDFKKLMPHVWVVLGFLGLALLFCYPVLEGKVLSSGDNISWQAMYHEAKMYHDSTGINPLWTNNMFGGMPLYTIGIPESNNYLGLFQLLVTSVLAKPVYFFFLAMVFFYVLMCVMGVDRWAGVIGAIAYAFIYNAVLVAAGHETKVFAISYLPGVLAGLALVYRGRWATGSALLGVALALMVSSNHFQIMYYAFILILFYVVGKFVITIREKGDVKAFFVRSGIALVVAAIAVGPSMGYILTTREYAKVTMRGGESELTINKSETKKAGGLDKDYAFQWSSGVGESLTMMIPYLYGGSSGEPSEKAPETESLTGGQYPQLPLYWGGQNLGIAGPQYFGAVICFLFVLGIFVVRSGHKWWIVAMCVLAIMMSWGDHFKTFNYFLFDNLPMYNKFRVPTIILSIPQLLFPLLGMWGLTEILRGHIKGEELWKKVKMAGGITAGLCVLVGLGGSMFFSYSNPAIDAQLPEQLIKSLKEDRAALATKSALTSAVYILLAAGLIWAFYKEKINRNILVGGIGLLVVIDILSVASNYLNEDNYQDASDYENVFQPRQVDQQILQDKDPYYRVLDLSKNVYNDATQAYFHKCIGGYSPAKMEIYQDLIDIQMGGVHSGGKFNAQVLNMLNTKYIIFQPGQQAQAPVYQPNAGALGNAWFVNEIKWAKTADEEMLNAAALGDTAMVANAFEPSRTAIIRSGFEKQLAGYQFGKDSVASIQLTKYGLNDLSYVSNNSQSGVAVFSDIYYPHGWEAYVDGKQVEILRANYVLRAIKIPAGQHKIDFHFRPKSFATGNTIAMISSIVLIGLLLAGIYVAVKGKKEDTVIEEQTEL